MKEITLFCVPGDNYKGKLELDVAKEYTKMASDEYDKIIRFEEEYAEKFAMNPDYSKLLFPKEGKNINLSVFAHQPVKYINNERVELRSSSNLFNPEFKLVSDKPLYLPDMEVIQITGQIEDLDRMTGAIINLYMGQNNWEVYVHDSPIKRIQVKPDKINRNRFKGNMEILDPREMIEIANRRTSYDSRRLAWTTFI